LGEYNLSFDFLLFGRCSFFFFSSPCFLGIPNCLLGYFFFWVASFYNLGILLIFFVLGDFEKVVAFIISFWGFLSFLLLGLSFTFFGRFFFFTPHHLCFLLCTFFLTIFLKVSR
jgi:hypothetical protein